MEEERRTGEPGPVLAPSQFDTLQKIVPASLAWLTYPTRAEWGFFRAAGAPPRDHYYGLELRTRHGANPVSAFVTNHAVR